MSEPTDGWSAPGGAPAPGYGPPPGPGPASAPGAPSGPPPGWQAPAGWGPQTTGAPAGAQPQWGQPQGGQPQWGAPRPPESRPGVIPLRPLGLGELLDGAVQVVRRYPRPTLGLSAVIALVSTVLNAVVLYTAFRPLAGLDSSSVETGSADVDAEIGGFFAGTIATAAITALATVVLAGVITSVIGRAVLGQPISFAEAWASVKPMILRLVGLAVLTALIVFGTLAAGLAVAVGLGAALGGVGVALGVLVGIAAALAAAWFYVRLSLAPSVMVLEKAGIRTSMTRSAVLVQRSWWRIFGILLLTFIITAIVSNVLQIPFALVGAGGGLLTGDVDAASISYVLAAAIGAGLSQALVAPFDTGVRALLYVDRRMRAEGLDVALQASSTGLPGGAPGGAVGL